MWRNDIFCEDVFTSRPNDTSPSALQRWVNRPGRPRRLSQFRITPLRMIWFFILTAIFIMVQRFFPGPLNRPNFELDEGDSNRRILPSVPFQPPEPIPYRVPDTVDTFLSYKYRTSCNISSLDLHAPFSPLCRNRPAMIAAMAGGGRIGRDAPYMPRGCDMRWFTSEEVCEILGRFDRVVLVGDSMLRHVIGSINILVRRDIGYGAVTDWNFTPQERAECFCNEQFDVKACSVQGIYKIADVLKHDSESLKCSNIINVIMEEIVRFPIPDEGLSRLKESIGGPTSNKKVFILGHGLWSNLDLRQSLHWVDKVLEVIKQTASSEWHGLFLTPNAAGKEKPDDWIVTQGNKALVLFEEAMGIEVAKRGLEHLGTWNMSIQANTYDGVHLDMKGNLVKAMMVMNWLSLLPK